MPYYEYDEKNNIIVEVPDIHDSELQPRHAGRAGPQVPQGYRQAPAQLEH